MPSDPKWLIIIWEIGAEFQGGAFMSGARRLPSFIIHVWIIREWSSTTEECKVIIVGWNCVLWWMVLQYHWYVEVKLGCFSVIYKGKYRSVNTALLNKLPLASFSLLEPQWCVKTTALTSAGWKIYRLASLFSWSSSPCSHTMATMANSFPLDKKIPSV